MTAGPDQSPREPGGYDGSPTSVGWPARPVHPAGAPVRPTDPESPPLEAEPSRADTVVASGGPSAQPPERPQSPTGGSAAMPPVAGAPVARPAMPAGPPVTPPSRPTGSSAPVAPSAATSAMTVGAGTSARKGGRRARLTLKRIDPWSVLKFSFVYSLAGLVVLLVAVIALYAIVDAMGVIDSIRTFLGDIDASKNGQGIAAWLSFSRVLAVALVLGAVNVILFTAFATLTAFVYNVCTDLVGGVEVTLAERG